MAKRDYKKEEKEEVPVPKLTVAHYKEISMLVKKYGGTNRVLAYWHAVMLDENGLIKSILDHSEHDEYTMKKYEDLTPLQGIKYMGQGHVTYIPFNWCTEWLSQWEWWVTQNPNLPENKGLLADPAKLKTLKEKIHTYEK